MNKVFVALLVFSAVGLGGTAGLSYGAETGAGQNSGVAPRPPIGEQTRAWLELQRSGREAGQAQPMSSDVAGRVYKRYVDSFTHPIPAFYERGDYSGGAATPR